MDPTDGRTALETLAPEPAAVLRRLCSLTAVRPSLDGVIRTTCADALELPPLPVASGGDPVSAVSVARFAQQFSLDVTGVVLPTDGSVTFEVAQATYVADMAPRVLALLDALFGPTADWGLDVPTEVDGGTSWQAIDDLLRVVHLLDALDPVTTEVVRLHGARQHDCRLCRSIRSRPALVAGATEEVFDAIDGSGTAALPGPGAAAVALADDMIWRPARPRPEVLERVRAELTAAQAVELVLDVMRNAANKIAVALGADAPNVTEGTEVYEIDADGVAHYGLAAP